MITRKILLILTALMFILAGVGIGVNHDAEAWTWLILAIVAGTALEVERSE